MTAIRVGMAALVLWIVSPDAAVRAEQAACKSFASCCPAFKDYVGNDCLVRIWPRGRIPYSFDSTIESAERPKIRAAMDQWQKLTGGRISFVESANDPARVVIQGKPKGGCTSGLPGRSANGLHRVNWETGCPYAHEAGHVIGLYHEHQRFDRDRYLAFQPSLVNCDKYYDVVKRCSMTTDTNYGEYNVESVMHYRFGSPKPPCYMSVRGGPCPYMSVWDRIMPHDASNVLELYANKELGWSPFRAIGRDVGATAPLSPEIAPKVTVDGSPALTAQGDGSVNMFLRGTDGQLWHRFRTGDRWSDWYQLGGSLVSNPAAASLGRGSVVVAARLKSGRIGIRRFASGQWLPWADVPEPPGGAASAPALAAAGPDRLAVFVRGAKNNLWRLAYDGGAGRTYAAGDWADEGGEFVGDPSATSSGRNSIDVVVAVASKGLWHWSSSNGKSAWAAIGCCVDPASSPSIASRSAGSQDLVVRDENGRLQYRSWGKAAWSPWSQLGGLMTSSPAIVATSARRLDIVAVGTDRVLKHRFREQ